MQGMSSSSAIYADLYGHSPAESTTFIRHCYRHLVGSSLLFGGIPELQSVVVRSLTKTWGETTAVDGVSFAVSPGQLVVLLGPSGCGKSTTLRLIAGLDEPTAGTIEIGGKDVLGLTGA